MKNRTEHLDNALTILDALLENLKEDLAEVHGTYADASYDFAAENALMLADQIRIGAVRALDELNKYL